MRYHGIDISHHQLPLSLPWDAIAESSQFVIARATYGTKRDRLTTRHVSDARGRGLRTGCYHFFRPVQSIRAQIEAFLDVCSACSISEGDIVPSLDIEDDPFGAKLSPVFAEVAHEAAKRIEDRYGVPCMVYITQRDWRRLGRPEWLLDRFLWIAHWTDGKPATPDGMRAHVHQYSVGPYAPRRPHRKGQERLAGAIDHNVASDPLPLIGRDIRAIKGLPAHPLDGLDWEEDHRKARDAMIRAEETPDAW